MKKIILIKLGMLLLINVNTYSQDVKCTNIDSLFLSHFLSIETKLECDTTEITVPENDYRFIYVLSYFSGISFNMHSYSGHPMVNSEKLLLYKRWYLKNRQKISCELYVTAWNLLDKIVKLNFILKEEQFEKEFVG